jgi:GH24 family phage-related lysozyme (muramidase)
MDGYLHKEANDPRELSIAHAFHTLRKREGWEPKVYKAPEGNPTVGWGINLAAQGPRLRKQLGKSRYDAIATGKAAIKPSENYRFSRGYLTSSYDALNKKVPGWQQLPTKARAALLDMHYNSPALIGPRLLGFLKNRQWNQAAGEIAYGHKGEFPGLITRRMDNANQFAKALGLKLQLQTGKRKDLPQFYQQHMKQYGGI